MAVYPVILCGGSGSRLWPVSSASRPKQFIALVGRRSTFQKTVLRFDGLGEGSTVIIVAGRAHTEIISDQLAELGRAAQLIVEPEGRDSAAAIAAAAYWIASRDPTGIALVVASDHDLPDTSAFIEAAEVAIRSATEGVIVTFGVRPATPSSAYGYIRIGPPIGDSGAYKAAAFVEKPSAALAKAYIQEGYLWNSGNFVFEVAVFLAELAIHAPAVAQAVLTAVDDAKATPSGVFLGQAFLTSPRISVDHAVLEPSDRTAVVPVSYAWSDLGSWDAVLAASERDEYGNAITGRAQLLDCSSTLVRAGGDQHVAVVGAKNIAVIVEPHAILVCDLAASQSVKRVLESREIGLAATPTDAVGSLKRFLVAEAVGLDLWLRTSALPLWGAVGMDHMSPGFHDAIGMDGRPVWSPRRLIVQAGQVHVYARRGTARLGRSLAFNNGPGPADYRRSLSTPRRRIPRPGRHRTAQRWTSRPRSRVRPSC